MNTEQNKTIAPIVHINGTSGIDLIEDRLKCLRALEATIEAFQQTRPHMRDYYHTDNYNEAYAQHENRLIALDTILNSINAELELLAPQVRY